MAKPNIDALSDRIFKAISDYVARGIGQLLPRLDRHQRQLAALEARLGELEAAFVERKE